MRGETSGPPGSLGGPVRFRCCGIRQGIRGFVRKCVIGVRRRRRCRA
jgi:hypothetical protein